MASLYEIGEGAFVRVAFTDPADGTPTDPTTVTFRVLAPSQAEGAPTVYVWGTDAEVVKTGTGTYEVLVTLDEEGWWQYRWEGENAAPAVQEGSLIVRGSDLT